MREGTTTAKYEESLSQRLSRIRDSFYAAVRPPAPSQVVTEDQYVREVFEDYVIVESQQGLLKYPYTEGDDGTITFGTPEKVEETFVSAREGTGEMFQKDIEFKVCSEEQRLVGGIGLVTGEVDYYGDYWAPEDVRDVSLRFMEHYRHVDFMHTTRVCAVPVESMYLPTEKEGGQKEYKLYGQKIPGGSWWVTARVTDDEAWEDVKAKKLTGFSIFAVKKPTVAYAAYSASAQYGDPVPRRMKADEWTVTMLSLVDKPAVKKALFYTVKRAPDGAPEFVEYTGKTVSDSNLGKLRTAYDALAELISVAEKERKEVSQRMPEPTVQNNQPQGGTGDSVVQMSEVMAELNTVKESLGQIGESVKALSDQLGAADVAQQVKDAVNNATNDLQQQSEEAIRPLREKIEELETSVSAVTRKSNRLPTGSSSEGDRSSGRVSWANPTGGPRKTN